MCMTRARGRGRGDDHRGPACMGRCEWARPDIRHLQFGCIKDNRCKTQRLVMEKKRAILSHGYSYETDRDIAIPKVMVRRWLEYCPIQRASLDTMGEPNQSNLPSIQSRVQIVIPYKIIRFDKVCSQEVCSQQWPSNAGTSSARCQVYTFTHEIQIFRDFFRPRMRLQQSISGSDRQD
jgi:hypothetical protein